MGARLQALLLAVLAHAGQRPRWHREGEEEGLAFQGEIEVAGRSCQILAEVPAIGLDPDQEYKGKSY